MKELKITKTLKMNKIGRVLYDDDDDDNVIILEFTCHSRANCNLFFLIENCFTHFKVFVRNTVKSLYIN